MYISIYVIYIFMGIYMYMYIYIYIYIYRSTGEKNAHSDENRALPLNGF